MKEARDSRHIYQNKLDKACFQHDLAYGDFKGLTRRAASDKILRDKAFNIAKNPKYDGYQRGLASMIYKFFDKKTSIETAKNEHISNKESNRKPSKIWVDKSSEFYNRSAKSWFKKNAIEMYSTHSQGKSVDAERFIRTLKNKIYKYMTSISKSVYIDKLDDIVVNTTIHIIEQLK